MGSSLGHRSTRHGKRDGRRADPRAVGYQVCVVNQGLTKHAILMYREIIRIKQRWQRCVVGGWVWRTLIAGLIYGGPRVYSTSTEESLLRRFWAWLNAAQVYMEKSEYFITQNFGVHSRLHRMGDTPSSCLDTDGLCR
jgi:hypothetical protein